MLFGLGTSRFNKFTKRIGSASRSLEATPSISPAFSMRRPARFHVQHDAGFLRAQLMERDLTSTHGACGRETNLADGDSAIYMGC